MVVYLIILLKHLSIVDSWGLELALPRLQWLSIEVTLQQEGPLYCPHYKNNSAREYWIVFSVQYLCILTSTRHRHGFMFIFMMAVDEVNNNTNQF